MVTANCANSSSTEPELHLVRDRTSPLTAWVDGLKERAHVNVAAVAMANKLARIAWAVLTKDERYRVNALNRL
jgi:hypothetical protein